jgi:hypothetical protein
MDPHRGILINRISVDGLGGIIFVTSMVVLFLIGVPALRPLVALTVVCGVLCAPLVRKLHSH